ncbi:MAG: sporulation peptidase YabG [Solirubrobacterales bacterium]
MQIGDIVVRKSYGCDVTFKIIDIVYGEGGKTYLLKGIKLRILADAPEDDLKPAPEDFSSESEMFFTRRVNSSIKKILRYRENQEDMFRSPKIENDKDLIFGRPGKILHIDGDADYLENCLKVYKQLKLNVTGKVVREREQPLKAVEFVKEIKPDIVVVTGHDSINKEAKDYMDLNNYKNSSYYVETVNALRNYKSNYDDLVIFAGACQSNYEKILDSGANFASSPGRVLIHCLDPVFLCEKIAYANIDKVVSIQEALENTITGTKGIGGLQTRGKYREGFPKSSYA